jgi:hypothetical protein
MGIRKLGDIITLDFTTHNPFTGAVQDTDSLPTCEVFEDENDSEILIPIVTKRVGKIGNYRVSIEATIGNGFEIGKSYNTIISATVNNISAKSRIESFVLDSKRINDLNDISGGGLTVEQDAILRRALGLGMENYRIFSPVYDTNGNMTTATIKIYPSASDCDADTNVTATYTVTSTYDSNHRMATYKVKKI